MGHDHEFTITWTYTACDACGNCASIDRIIIVKDTTPPCFSELPPNEDVECDNIPPPCTVTTIGENIVVTTDHSDIVTDSHGEKHITRRWSAVDQSGNAATHVQILHVVDNSPPVLSRYPESTTVSCSCDSFPLPPAVNAMDNCDFSLFAANFTEDKIVLDSDSQDSYALERIWYAADNSGRSVSHKQVITVQDNESPVLSQTPQDAEAECNSVPSLPSIYIKDICDPDVAVSYDSSQINGDCEHTYTIERRWSGQDRTGNSVAWAQKIEVRDTQKPIFEDSESECILPNKQYKEYDTQTFFSVTDNCDNSVQFHIYTCNSTVSGNQAFDVTCHFDMQRSILSVYADVSENEPEGRTYSIYAESTDKCGNQAFHVREIWIPRTVEDAAMEGLVCEIADVDSLVDNPYQ